MNPLSFAALAALILVLIGRGRRPAERNHAEEAAARALLGVREGACREEIETAWRAGMSRAHPDRGGSAAEAAALNAARDKLLKS